MVVPKALGPDTHVSHPEAISRYSVYGLVGLELVLALITGFCFTLLGLGGGAWILGGIVIGALVFYSYRVLYQPQATPNRTARKAGQMLVGLTVGLSIQHSNLQSIVPQLPVLLLLTILLLFLTGGAIGYLYARLEKTTFLTATLATVPGNIGVMASVAADQGSDVAIVSLVQLIRFTTVILVVPLLIHVSAPHDLHTTLAFVTQGLFTLDRIYLLQLAIALTSATAIVSLGSKLKLSIAAFLGSILVGLSFNPGLELINFPAADFNLPPLLNLAGQVLLGLTIGEYWGMNPRLEARTFRRAVIPVILTCLTGLLVAGVAALLTPWDWLTCLLVAAPGGSPEMILIALALHRNVEAVTAAHLIRLIMINSSLPLLIAWANYLERQDSRAKQRIGLP